MAKKKLLNPKQEASLKKLIHQATKESEDLTDEERYSIFVTP